MKVQEQEIRNVKELYESNINNLVDAIEKYRLEIINIYEKSYLEKYSKAFDLETDADGQPSPQEVPPTGDPDVDFIHLSTLKKINNFFEEQRKKVREDIAVRRKQYHLIQANYENIETVNAAVSDYLASLSRLKNARDTAARALSRQVEGIFPIPVSLAKLPDPSTIEDLVEAFKP
jgi:hypothetical protein